MPRVLFTTAARSDLDDALSWYEMHAPEMLPLFCEAVQVTIKRIGERPKQFPAGRHKTRRALLRRFPFLAIFRETEGAIYVVALFHTSRDPLAWERRA